ncbi:MAG: tetratricopeptide repeat protein [Planctomycetota bacterium]
MVFFLLVALAGCGGGPEVGSGEARLLEWAETAFLRGDYAQASRHYESFLERSPESSRRAAILVMVARCRMGENRWEEALELLDRALSAGPQAEVRVEAYYRRAIAENAMWDPRAALRDLLVVEQSSDGVRGRAVREDEFRYRLGVTRIRAGEWRKGKADLARVDPKGPLGDAARIRMSLEEFSVQIAHYRDAASARQKADEAGAGARVHVCGADHVVLVGSYRGFEAARMQAERLRRKFPGAFVIP